jgi:hypothetical protein
MQRPKLSAGSAAALVLGNLALASVLRTWFRQSPAETASRGAPAQATARLEQESEALAARPKAPASPAGAAGDLLPIDRMSRADNAIDAQGFGGFWYSFDDGWGRLEPRPGRDLLSTSVVGGRRARRLVGGGQDEWGAGMGFNLIAPRAEGAAQTDAGFDASAYGGLEFLAFSRSGLLTVRVAVSDANTDPAGGVCDPSSREPVAACHGDYGTEVTLPEGQWSTHRVLFSELTLPTWTYLEPAKKSGFVRNRVFAVSFILTTKSGVSLPPFELDVADVSFVEGDARESRR